MLESDLYIGMRLYQIPHLTGRKLSGNEQKTYVTGDQ